jgi:hypothetical protein
VTVEISRRQRLSAADLGRFCLDHLAGDPARLAAFMEVAGYDPPGLRAALGSRQLDLGLVDYFASNEPLMLAVCAANGLRPEDFMRVWHDGNRSL